MEQFGEQYIYRKNPNLTRYLLLAVTISFCWGNSGAIAANTYVVKHAFDGPDGYYPNGVVVDEAGNEYGLAGGGGTSYCANNGSTGCGVLYKVSPAGKFSILFNFNGSNGSVAVQKLVLSKNKLYGTTETGGEFGQGVVFSIGLDGTNFQLLLSFSGSDGFGPLGSIAVDAHGNLFGTTAAGGPTYNTKTGANGYGVLFEIASNSTFSQLHQFTGGADGDDPAGVVLGPLGYVYGSTLAGTVFKFSPGTDAFVTIQTFPNTGNTLPYLAAVGTEGVVYGYQSSIGAPAGAYGTLFELLPRQNGYTFKLVHAFTGTGPDGAYPTGLTVTGPGQMVGVTNYGSYAKKPRPLGTIFSYSSGSLTTLYNFLGGFKRGIYPDASPTVTASGAILGTTQSGGSKTCPDGNYECGVTFRFTP